jgi:hypothetical protein
VRFGWGTTKILLEPVQDQSMLDFLRLPHVGIEGLAGLVGIGQQYEELQNIAVDFQLNSREIVDNVPELLGDKSRPLDRSINRIQRDRRVKLTQPLNVFSDLFLGDVLPGHTRHFKDPPCALKQLVSHTESCGGTLGRCPEPQPKQVAAARGG